MKTLTRIAVTYRSMLARIKRGIAILRLTRNCWRATQLRERDWFYIGGKRTIMRGPHSVSLLCECYLYDAYGLRMIESDFAGTIADIGANIGAFAVAARRRFPKAIIHAYEPAGEIFAFLSGNVKGMGIQIHQSAVSDMEGEAILATGFDTTSAHLERPSTHPGVLGERVPCVTLETVIKQCGGRIDLLKLDCEGSEYEILKSRAMAGVRRVVAEIHDGPGLEPQTAIESLKRQGFTIEQWHGGIVHARRLF